MCIPNETVRKNIAEAFRWDLRDMSLHLESLPPQNAAEIIAVSQYRPAEATLERVTGNPQLLEICAVTTVGSDLWLVAMSKLSAGKHDDARLTATMKSLFLAELGWNPKDEQLDPDESTSSGGNLRRAILAFLCSTPESEEEIAARSALMACCDEASPNDFLIEMNAWTDTSMSDSVVYNWLCLQLTTHPKSTANFWIKVVESLSPDEASLRINTWPDSTIDWAVSEATRKLMAGDGNAEADGQLEQLRGLTSLLYPTTSAHRNLTNLIVKLAMGSGRLDTLALVYNDESTPCDIRASIISYLRSLAN